MDIQAIKDKTLLDVWKERDPIESSLVIKLNDDTRIHMEQFRYTYIFVIPATPDGGARLGTKFRVSETFTVAQCIDLGATLLALVRDPIGISSVVNAYLHACDDNHFTEETILPTVRTGSNGEA